MLNLIFKEIIEAQRLHGFLFWVLLAYTVVMLSMLVDFITAFLRCKRVGEKWVSDKQKRTSEKAQKYFLPMVAVTLVDILCFVITKYPVFTLLLAAVNSLTEWLSVFEKTHTKQEQREAAKTMNVILKNKEDIAKTIADVIQTKTEWKQLTENGKPTTK